MKHVNPDLRNYGFQGLLSDLALPLAYYATTISDFIEGRRSVKRTSFWRTVGYTLALRSGGIHLLGNVGVFFHNVRYSRNNDQVDLEDTTQRLTVGLHDPESHAESVATQGIREGDNLQLASIIYNPTRDVSQLVAVKKILDIKSPDAGFDPVRYLAPPFQFS